MFTAHVICQAKHVISPGAEDERVQLTFAPDFDDERNHEWAAVHSDGQPGQPPRPLPDLGMVVTVKPEIADQFVQGARYSLPITPED